MISACQLTALDGVDHAFFTRKGGVSTGIYESLNIGLGSDDARVSVLENRARVARAFALPGEALVSPHQHHSAIAVTVREPWQADSGPRADALVTDRPDILLGISTADCGPVLFADGKARVVGAAHAGWRGALGGVLEATLEAMIAIGAERGRIVAVLGPTISAKAYEVGDDFAERFTQADASNRQFFHPARRPGHTMFDLPAYIVARLGEAGIGIVADLGRCTYDDDENFFSYRRMTHRGEGDYGRQISAICVREAGNE